MEIILSLGLVLGVLVVGAYLVAIVDAGWMRAIAGRNGPLLMGPLYRAALLWQTPANTTEAPDYPAWRMAPAFYLALAAIGLALVPWSPRFVPVDVTTGLVLWGALEPLATVAIFLHGWSANSHFPLLGGYRYVALGLSYLLISMFVLIGVALPAESLRVNAVVVSQQDLWNLIRQPLGFPLFLIVGLGIAFWGPLNFADSTDLAGGTSSETSGRARALWYFARASMLVAFSGIAASAFLGGWQGPLLPGPAWLALKMGLVLVLLMLLGRLLPRPSPEQFLTLCWVVLLPLAFVDLLWAGLEALS